MALKVLRVLRAFGVIVYLLDDLDLLNRKRREEKGGISPRFILEWEQCLLPILPCDALSLLPSRRMKKVEGAFGTHTRPF